jgi:hypothetical protein
MTIMEIMKKWYCFSLFFFFLCLPLSSIAAQSKYFLWEASLGYHNLAYEELASSTTSFTEQSGTINLGFKYMIFADWLFLTTDLRLIAPVTHTTKKGYEATFANHQTSLRWKFPADPLYIIFSAHYFDSFMKAKPENFGYKKISGVKYSVELFLSKLNKHFNIFFRYPFKNQLDYRFQKEYTTGIVLFITPTEESHPSLPFYFRKGSFLRYSFTSIKDSITSESKHRKFIFSFAEIGWVW